LGNNLHISIFRTTLLFGVYLYISIFRTNISLWGYGFGCRRCLSTMLHASILLSLHACGHIQCELNG